MHAYVLIMTRMGEMDHVATAARRLEHVTRATEILGEYDIMLELRAKDLSELDHVLEHIQSLPGVDRAVFCAAPDVDHEIGPIAREQVLASTAPPRARSGS